MGEVLVLVSEMSMISPMVEETGPSTGGATPAGSCTRWSFSVTSWRARKMSVPSSNSTKMIEIPTAELERTRNTSVVPFMAVSIGTVTSASTSSGARPWASVSTVTVGAVRSGKTSTGVRAVTKAP
jgi:hypothetical protein